MIILRIIAAIATSLLFGRALYDYINDGLLTTNDGDVAPALAAAFLAVLGIVALVCVDAAVR